MTFNIGHHVKSVCIFAAQRSFFIFPDNTILYVNELARHFDSVIISTNDEIPYIHDIGLPSNCHVHLCANRGLDFGKYWSVFKTFDLKNKPLEKIALVNDSCCILSTLDNLFKWGQSRLFWGVSHSYEKSFHIQSFFLVFQTPVVLRLLFDFVQKHDIFAYSNKKDIIDNFEIGLSSFMAHHHIVGKGMYNEIVLKDVRTTCPFTKPINSKPNINVSLFLWDRMLELGCPIYKKKRFNSLDDQSFISTKENKAFLKQQHDF